jgi:hypothetical protein
MEQAISSLPAQLGVAGGCLLVLALFAVGVLKLMQRFSDRTFDLLENTVKANHTATTAQLDRIEGHVAQHRCHYPAGPRLCPGTDPSNLDPGDVE